MPRPIPARLLASAVALTGMLLVPQVATAQFGLAARASTLGFGGEVSYRSSKTIGVRVGGNYFQLTKDFDSNGNPYQLTAQLKNFTAIVDLFPTGGSFHLSGGVLYNKNNGIMDGKVTSSFDLGGRTYPAGQVSSLTGTVDFRHTAGYLGLGFSGRSRLSFLFDLGVGFTGTPRLSLAGTTTLLGTQKAQFDADVLAEENKIRTENIEGKSYLKYHPVLSLGLKFGL